MPTPLPTPSESLDGDDDAAEALANPKATTRRIVISDPDEELLRKHLAGRRVSPKLERFLKSLTNGKRWTRKINIPSTHENLAAVLLFTSDLKEGGLEISSELHVFLEDTVIIERWQVLGEHQKTSSMPTQMLLAMEIQKVRLNGSRVSVELRVPVPDAEPKVAMRIIDFMENGPTVRTVANPFL
jgi:hypothetical protein